MKRLCYLYLTSLTILFLLSANALAQMEPTTGGVTLRKIDGERFVVRPAGSLDNPPWTVGGQPAVMLSKR